MGTDRDPSDAAGGPDAGGPGSDPRDDRGGSDPRDDEAEKSDSASGAGGDTGDETTDAVPADADEEGDLEVVAVDSLDGDEAHEPSGRGGSHRVRGSHRDDGPEGRQNPTGSDADPGRSNPKDDLGRPGHAQRRGDGPAEDEAFAAGRVDGDDAYACRSGDDRVYSETEADGWRRWAELGDDTDQGRRQGGYGRWRATEQAGSRHERLFAGLLSFFLPGVGHVIAGHSTRGAAVLAGTLIWVAFHWFVLVPFFAVVLGGMTVFLLGIGALLAPVFGAGTQFVVHVLAGLDAHRQVGEMR